jgi:predicted TIM-barrel fold metal-dependent hydrolase
MIHGDPAVIDAIFERTPQATVVWAHGGTFPCPDLLRDYLRRYPRLYADLSMRDDRVAPGGRLDPDWEWLLLEHAERFMVGVDTFSRGRWQDYARHAARIRAWLGQLPPDVAQRVARGNALAVYGAGGAQAR